MQVVTGGKRKGVSDEMERESRMTKVTAGATSQPLQPKLIPMDSLILMKSSLIRSTIHFTVRRLSGDSASRQ